MTWYCWNHWFWITGWLTTGIFVLTFCSVCSYPISPIEEIKEYNNKELPLKYPINLPSNDDHDIDDIYMGQQNIPLLSEDNLKEIIIEQNKNQLIEKNDEILKKHNNKTIEDNLIINKNQSNNSNLNNISNVIKLVPDTTTNLNDKLKINNNENVSENINQSNVKEIETENLNLKNDSNFSIVSTNNNKTLQNIQLNESADSTQSNIMQIKKNINSTILPPPSSQPPSLQSQQIFVENNNESSTTTTAIIFDSTASNYSDDNDDDDEIGNITKLDLVITTINSTIDNSTESNDKISTKLENVTKMINDSYDNNGNINEPEYIRKSKGLLSSEYRDGSRSINFPTESKNLLTRSAVSSDLQLISNEQQQHEDGGNVSSEALQITGVMDAGTISGICFSVFALCIGVSMFGIIIYRRRFLNKPQTLNEPDSSVYIDDSTIRDNSDEMYSLDNDSFLNSLEAMTIQNYWTDTVKHTKL